MVPGEIVLDTFALLALLGREPGAARVRDVLQGAAVGDVTVRLSAINLGEAVYMVERRAGLSGVHRFLAMLGQAPIVIEDASRVRILAAAHVKAQFAVSYADAFAVALAQEYAATVLTGDPEFRSVAGLVSVEWLPQRP